jgi:glycosyltransferase involved in cell wall biosynthesis
MNNVTVFMLSWEFPPRIIGGIAAHVHDLALALGQLNLDVKVITCDFPGAKDYEEIDGISVHRIDSYKYPTSNFASWVYMMNLNMQEYAIHLIRDEIEKGKTCVLHSHDWLVAKVAIGLKHLFRIPLLATIHSTEHGRRKGIHSEYQRMIHQTELWLASEAWRVICCSAYMAEQVSRLFHVPFTRIDTIPNGVNAVQYATVPPSPTFKLQYADRNEKLVLYVGRLVYEKGVSVLVDAVNLVQQKLNAKFVIVGDGYMRDRLVDQARRVGAMNKMFFTGFLDEASVKKLYRVADVFVIPSLYEPFGIVALEGMASGVPLVASGVGGLAEIITHDETGVLVYPDNPESLAWGINRVLTDPGYAQWLRENALEHVTTAYNWDAIAATTSTVYDQIVSEYLEGSWGVKQ